LPLTKPSKIEEGKRLKVKAKSQNSSVNQLDLVKSGITQLTLVELTQLKIWLIDLIEDQWDKQIEADSQAGKLDFLIEEAQLAARNGKTKPL
jgi:hypothetical protein